jgi:uncharacterized protein (TIGR04141 family)
VTHPDQPPSIIDFIDFLRPERSPARVQALESKLLEALNGEQLVDIHLAAPEPLDWIDIDGFRFSTQSDAVSGGVCRDHAQYTSDTAHAPILQSRQLARCGQSSTRLRIPRRRRRGA